MRKLTLLLILTLICPGILVFGEDFSFEIPAKDTPDRIELSWSGNLETGYSWFRARNASPIYSVQFANSDISSDQLTRFDMNLYLNADYQAKDIGFHLKSHLAYENDENEVAIDILELYGNYNLTLSSFFQVGKIRHNWGKGYAFNPVGFINPTKDPTNPNAAKEGIFSGNYEFVKSFASDFLSSFAMTLVVIPPTEDINNRFAEMSDTRLAMKLSTLAGSADIDLMGYIGADSETRWGFTFAKNIRSDFEIHIERAFFAGETKNLIVNNQLAQVETDGSVSLRGIRWLTPWDITLITEHYYNDAGLTHTEYIDYLSFLQSSLGSGNSSLINQAASYKQQYFNAANLGQNYLYLDIQVPEPFDWLYFTQSFSFLINLGDQSALVSCESIYKPVTNLTLAVKPSIMTGGDNTEYGSQQFNSKIELTANWFF